MSQGSKIKLRRPKTLIEKNLQPLKANNKKEIAQRFYYNKNNSHKSILITERKKPPVHQRLGLKQKMPLGTSTNFILQKRRKIQSNKQPFELKARRLQTFSTKSRLNKSQSSQIMTTSGIKLRRLTPAKNLTIQLKNSNFTSRSDLLRRFKMELNPRIQAEILEIQTENKSNEINFLPTLRIKPVSTGISFTDSRVISDITILFCIFYI
ncbi:uncharacterized protein LOC143203255 [Rhynchophorus ferrugineus]|uniref:Uncharacterized protein n=1 Tax=Rhynchophorus ferrugineus TaxID=354439 RepID=A0A834IIA1_RHYFE|nr:hypothetical protein GWI33_007026 [Rhynchophorus ferrugineus]